MTGRPRRHSSVAGGPLPGARGLAAAAILWAFLPPACGPPEVPAEWTLQLIEEVVIGADPVSPATAFYRPSALGFDHLGNLYVLDSGNHRVQVFDASGAFLRTVGEAGEGPGQLGDPQGMFVHPDGRVWIADTRNRRLQPYSPTGIGEAPIVVDFFPFDLVVDTDRMFVQRMPQANMAYGPDPTPIIQVLDRNGEPAGGFVEPAEAPAGILYLLENMVAMAPAPGGGVALSDTHFASRIRVFGAGGGLRREIAVLYKASAWAPLGRRPRLLNDQSLDRVARTATDLAWDPRRRLFWVLAGYVDRTAQEEWIVGRETYRYDVEGAYRGSLMLPQRAVVLGVSPDGRVWTIDLDGVVRGFRVADPEGAG